MIFGVAALVCRCWCATNSLLHVIQELISTCAVVLISRVDRDQVDLPWLLSLVLVTSRGQWACAARGC